MIPFILSLLLALAAYIIVGGLSVPVIFLLFFLFGWLITRSFNKGLHRINSVQIFQFSFLSYFVYALLCFLYMRTNDLQYLQSFDGYDVYIPYTIQLIETNSFFELISKIYGTPHYSFVGSILVLFVYTGKLSQLFDGELYLTIQLSLMIFSALVPVVIYRLLVFHGIFEQKAYRYTMMYSLVSVHFLMASYIVRDMPITLFYTIIIYLSFQKYSTKNIIYIIVLILLILSIRVSSGIFAFIYLLLVVFINNYRKKDSITPQMLSATFLMVVIFVVTIIYFNTALDIFLTKQASYSAKEIADQDGGSTKAAFNVLPPIFSELAKTVYNQIMDIPSWRRLTQESWPEVYNIMNFPEVGATLFRYWMWGFIFLGLQDRNLRRLISKDKVLLYNIVIAIIFLMLQSDTLGHRRMMGVYPIFFLTSCIVYENLNVKNRKTGFFIVLGFFSMVQLLGLLYLS